jgi:autotransporter adhesin
VVSVGAAGAPRQIQNVAAGVVSATSTDAVNGSQLYSVASAANAIGTSVAAALGGGAVYTAGQGITTAPTYTIQNANYNNVGAAFTAVDGAITQTNTNVANLSDGIVHGTIGLVQQTGGAPGAGTITVGAGTQGTVVDFSNSNGAARVLSGVAPGMAATDAVDVGQLQMALSNSVQYDSPARTSVTLAGPTSSDGGVTGGTTISNLHQGAVSATSTQAVNGAQLYANITNGAAGPFQVYQSGAVVQPIASGVNSTAGGDGALASGQGGTAIGNHAISTGAGSVALGAFSNDGGQSNVLSIGTPGSERRIVNVAPGVNGTDAVNVNQLFGLRRGLEQEADAGAALALAATGLRYDERPGTTSIAGGASYYNAHEGIAFGLGHTSDDGNWRYNVAASFVTPRDHADVGVSAGFTYTFAH